MKTLLLVFCVAFATVAHARQIQPQLVGESLQIQPPSTFAWIKEILAPWSGWWQDNGVRKQPSSPDSNYIP